VGGNTNYCVLTDLKDISFKSPGVLKMIMLSSKDNMPSGAAIDLVILKVMKGAADACLCLPAGYYAACKAAGALRCQLAVRYPAIVSALNSFESETK